MPTDSPFVTSLVSEGMELVVRIAHRLRRETGESVDVEELKSAGNEALVMAARSFDPTQGARFSTWAGIRVRGAMIDSLRKRTGVPRAVYRQVRALSADNKLDEVWADEAGGKASDTDLSEKLAASALALAIGLLSAKGGETLDATRDDEAPSPEEVAARKQVIDRIQAAIDTRPEAEKKLLMRHYFDDVPFEEAAKELGLSKSWASRLHARAISGLAADLKAAR